ncbi:hypothetical protein ACFU53_23810 [Streptomyces sp. NPDC057474]|uniref:hypothetical protein n=1 Tax=Streptomyces sp. NPDC057474 TaxID=3346144 RepID=UPI0036BE9275
MNWHKDHHLPRRSIGSYLTARPWLELYPTADVPMEIEPYDAVDWENCPACGELNRLCRYHEGYTTGYEALKQPLTEAASVLFREGFTAVHQVDPTPTGATVPNDALSPERIADAVAVLRKGAGRRPEGTPRPCLVLPGVRRAGDADRSRSISRTRRPRRIGGDAPSDHPERGVAGLGGHLHLGPRVAARFRDLGAYASRAEAIREAVRAATDNGWMLDPEHQWSDFDCGGGEVHIPIHSRPTR